MLLNVFKLVNVKYKILIDLTRATALATIIVRKILISNWTMDDLQIPNIGFGTASTVQVRKNRFRFKEKEIFDEKRTNFCW